MVKKVGFKRFKLIIVGRGKEQSLQHKLSEIAMVAYNRLKSEGCLEEYDVITEEKKVELILKSNILVLPSCVETFPLVAIEALMLGRKVVVADIPTVSSFVRALKLQRYVALVKFGNVEELARKILEVWYRDLGLFKPPSWLRNSLGLYGLASRLYNAYRKVLSGNY